MMDRGFLALYALLFLAFGVFAFWNPNWAMNLLGASNMSSEGVYELRSNYGGVSFGIGLMCLASVFRSELTRPALFVLMAYMGGYSIGRLAAMPIDGVPSTTMIAYASFEIVSAVLAFALLRRAVQSR